MSQNLRPKQNLTEEISAIGEQVQQSFFSKLPQKLIDHLKFTLSYFISYTFN